MTITTEFRFEGRDGASIAAYRWEPEGAPRAVVQLVHGVGEHMRRYDHLGTTLARAGVLVQGHDSRGHGASIAPGAEPGVIGSAGWTESLNDIDVLVRRAREEHPGLPLVLLGHSMGSSAVQQYFVAHSDQLDAIVLSGTAAADLVEAFVDLDAPMDFAAYNAAFEHRTGFEWLSRDPAQVDRYLADPLCGFGYDVDAMKAMFAEGRIAADPERLAKVRSDVPIYIVVGEQDPVNAQLALVSPLIERYRAAGLTDVTLRVYEGARHEVFNETNRDEVEADLLSWIDQVVGAKA